MQTTLVHEKVIQIGYALKDSAPIVFGDMVQRAMPHLTRYHSDLFHDANQLRLLFGCGESTVEFVYVVRDSGTHILDGDERNAETLAAVYMMAQADDNLAVFAYQITWRDDKSTLRVKQLHPFTL